MKENFNITASIMTVAEDGDKEWRQNDQLHREDGPAVERANGNKLWFRNGQVHRDDGPALEVADGSKWWFRDGRLDREGGPACEDGKGHKNWYRRGKLHREDGPAVEYADGSVEWWKLGKKIAAFTAQEAADHIAAFAENRHRDIQKSLTQGLPQTITIRWPFRLRL